MRIANKQVTVRSILFGKPAGVVYFFITCLFIYKCLMLLPIWLTTKDKAAQAEMDYNKKVTLANQKKLQEQNSETDMGKERYQKDFYNKLDEGENMIILYGNETTTQSVNEEGRKMFWWEQKQQDFIVWWKNLQILKR